MSTSPTSQDREPEVLADLADRLRRAKRELEDLALGTIGDFEKRRLVAKAEGVGLALSYVQEARRA